MRQAIIPEILVEEETPMALPKYPTKDVEDYLLLDRNSKDARYEYLDGELRMLVGGSRYHSAIRKATRA